MQLPFLLHPLSAGEPGGFSLVNNLPTLADEPTILASNGRLTANHRHPALPTRRGRRKSEPADGAKHTGGFTLESGTCTDV